MREQELGYVLRRPGVPFFPSHIRISGNPLMVLLDADYTAGV
jgi:hypothetical protein